MGNILGVCQYEEQPTYGVCKDGKINKIFKSRNKACTDKIAQLKCVSTTTPCTYDNEKDIFTSTTTVTTPQGALIKQSLDTCKDYCKLGEYGKWSDCRDGKMSRTRSTEDTEECKKHATQTKDCTECLLPKKVEECKLEDNGNMWYKVVTDVNVSKTEDLKCCNFSDWSHWSECKDGKTSRTRTTQNQSVDCVKATVEEKTCEPCVEGAWGECKSDLTQGSIQTKTYSVWDGELGSCVNKENSRICGTCSYKKTYSDCNPEDKQTVSAILLTGDPVCAPSLTPEVITPCKCKWGPWGPWSECKNNITTRVRKADGCEDIEEKAYCTPCGDGVWTDWSICEMNPETGKFTQRRVLAGDEYWDGNLGYCKLNDDVVEWRPCESKESNNCNYTYGDWSECKEGKTSRTLYTTVQGCTNKVEEKNCTNCAPGTWVATGTCGAGVTKIRSTLRNNYIWEPKLGACKLSIQYKDDTCPS